MEKSDRSISPPFHHNINMTGSPGSGKTLLARALPGILPEMSIEESLDVTRIYSVADQPPAGTPLIRRSPFRAPHRSPEVAPKDRLLFLQTFNWWVIKSSPAALTFSEGGN